MDTKVHISDEALRRLVLQIDARGVPARLARRERELVAERLRRAPMPGLRRRLSLV